MGTIALAIAMFIVGLALQAIVEEQQVSHFLTTTYSNLLFRQSRKKLEGVFSDYFCARVVVSVSPCLETTLTCYSEHTCCGTLEVECHCCV
jgi:hypothetical protein